MNFDNVLGYAEEKAELAKIADILKNTEKYRALGVETPRGLLLEGAPGLGKTTMANALIEESGRTVFRVRKEKTNGDFLEIIKTAFDEARAAAPSIVFLDDMDKFANEDEHHRNADEFVTIQSQIDECRGTEVFVLATANETDCLPGSLLRVGRFDRILTIKAPRHKDAVDIIEYYLSKKKAVSPDVDREEISRIMNGKSCAELETVINEAGIYAAYAGKSSIEMEDIIKACLRIIFDAPDTMNSEDEYAENVAYHEAGHAVINEVLEPGSVNLISIANHKGSISGITSYFQNENYFKDVRFMQNRVRGLLAGKAATELVFGRTDSGANNDLHRAFSICERFIDHYCSFGFGTFARRDSGTALADRKDLGIELEMSRFYAETRQILIENREFLDKLAGALLEKKTLLRSDIAAIRAAFAVQGGRAA